MNHFAYLATGQLIGMVQSLSRIRVVTHGEGTIPRGSIIFVVNHFTRLETVLLPYHIYSHTHVPVWSLADHSFFEGPFSNFLEKIGVVSTRSPHRDQLIVKTLLTGEANWIIFPEGEMVKNKEAVDSPSMFDWNRRGRRAHSGAGNLALRTEFYRKRLKRLVTDNPGEAERLRTMFGIDDLAPVLSRKTWIVPINLTYYPLRARENVLSSLADRLGWSVSKRLREEMLTEGTMFFEGVDIDIRFGQAIAAEESLSSPQVCRDMYSLRQINFDDRLPSLQIMRREARNLMRRFMSDIYSMTTVNHDHLFASLLRALPFNRISEEDFRRRVFLLTDLVPDKTLVFCHNSLEVGQVALLTDDRYRKYRDFLDLALETGVVKLEGGIILRCRAKFHEESEFHQIRIENPLGVVTNEVRHLSALQRKIWLTAWLPEIIVRHKVVDALLNRSSAQFESDYSQYYLHGLSKDRSIGAPLLLKGNSGKPGVVLLHGFLSAPREMLSLATCLNGCGFWVYCVRLRGHGTSPEDLATRGRSDWIESVDLGYALLKGLCGQVAVGGFSFGGGLALDAARRIPGVAAVFAVSPPFRLRDSASRLAPAVSAWNRIMDRFHLHGAAREYTHNSSEQPEINYERIPIAALAEMERMMEECEEGLGGVHAPTLVVQGVDDPVVSSRGTEELFGEIGAVSKEYLPVAASRHAILSGDGASQVHGAIARFLMQAVRQ